MKNDKHEERHGLLAIGSSGRWCISVDESLDGDDWSLELDGPILYLIFQLDDLTIPAKALDFMRRRPSTDEAGEDTLVLGRFGNATVSLIRDSESFPRYFFVVGPRARSTLRIGLAGEDLQSVIQALGEAVEEIPSAKPSLHAPAKRR
jgi:hypothetical protein